MSYPKLTPVIAKGTTEPRYLEDRFADVVNIKDFGAIGDGINDDTAALNNATAVAALGAKKLWLAGKKYKTDAIPSGVDMHDGYILFGGKSLNVDGAFSRLSCGNMMQRHACTISSQWNGSSATINWPQGVAYLNVDGVDKIFVTREVQGRVYGNAYGMFVISEYNLREDGGSAELVQETEPLPIGHGQGVGARIDPESGKIFLYFDEAGEPERYNASSDNAFLGVTIVEYKGSSTTRDDCTSYRLRQIRTLNPNNCKRLGSSGWIPTVSPDGKKLVVLTPYSLLIYSLEEIENCTTANIVYTWEDAGETIPYTAEQAGYTAPGTRYNAESVQPIVECVFDANKTRARQGITCDYKYIYISSGTGCRNSAHFIEVYDYAGNKVAEINHSNSMNETPLAVSGGDGDYVLAGWENEGLFVKDDALYVATITTRTPVSNPDVVLYNGEKYVCVVNSSIGVAPGLTNRGEWLPTELEANKGAWNSSTTYSYNGSGSAVISLDLWAIEPESGSSSQKPLSRNAVIDENNTLYSENSSFCIAKGCSFNIENVSPFTGDRTPMIKMRPTGLDVHGYTGTSGRMAINLVQGMVGSGADAIDTATTAYLVAYDKDNHASPRLRYYNRDHPVRPDWLVVEDMSGNEKIKISSDNLFLKIGSNSSTKNLVFFSDNDTDAMHIWREVGVGTVIGSAGTIVLAYCSGTKSASGGSLNDSDTRYSSLTKDNSVGITSNAFFPLKNNYCKLGNADHLWSEVFSATGSINTSDEREKSNVNQIDEKLIKAWSKVRLCLFQFNDAVEKKGKNARIHIGMVAQQIKEAFASEGLDASRYGLFCYDKWNDEFEEVEVVDVEQVVDEYGNVVVPKQTHKETIQTRVAGDKFGIRYEEALILECAYQRWRLEQLEERINQLTNFNK